MFLSFGLPLQMHHFTFILFCFNQDEEEGWKMAPSAFVPAVNEGTETYKGMVMIKLKYMLLLFCLFVVFVCFFQEIFAALKKIILIAVPRILKVSVKKLFFGVSNTHAATHFA